MTLRVMQLGITLSVLMPSVIMVVVIFIIVVNSVVILRVGELLANTKTIHLVRK
jgi:hypothetical protein